MNIFSPFSSSKKSESCPVVSDSLRLQGLQLARLLCPWNSPGKSTGVGSHSLLQGLVPTQGSNPGLTHCRQILYNLSHEGSPLLEIQHFYSFFFKMVNLIILTCILVLKLTSPFLCLLNKMNVIIPLIIQSFLKFEIMLDSREVKKKKSTEKSPLDFCQW